MRLGAHSNNGVVTIGVNATNEATCVFLCRPRQDGSEDRTPLTRMGENLWGGEFTNMRPGDLYGFRVHGPWDPRRGQRCNVNKLLLDPYARGHSSILEIHDSHFDNNLDSAGHTPWGVVIDDAFDWQGVERPRISRQDMVIYELHVAGFTRNFPGVPAELRGTYLALAHPAVIQYFVDMGWNTIQLQPIHAVGTEYRLQQMGMVNHWGYSTLGYFAPHLGYSVSGAAQGAVDEFKTMVRELHRAGIQVILDVVYNHTCEGPENQPLTLSWRGLDARGYYLLDHDGRQVDFTGAHNTLNFTSDLVTNMTLDSLRYWATEMQMDGPRFDLATVLGYDGYGGFNKRHPLFMAIENDPVLGSLTRIVEPWAPGGPGHQTGKFTEGWLEQDDASRDRVRDFWLVDAARNADGQPTGGLGDITFVFSGSSDVFSNSGLMTITNAAVHDGFPLADLTRYNTKHNEANREDNRDGENHNRSWNHGVEGDTADHEVNYRRRRSMRNLLGTVLLSIGVPMVRAGDELGHTQHGNNNAYCQPSLCNLHWQLEPWQKDLQETTKFLLKLRREYTVLRRTEFFTDRDASWLGTDGYPIQDDAWHHPWWRAMQFYLRPTDNRPEHSLLILLQGANNGVTFRLPQYIHPYWKLLWDSSSERPDERLILERSGGQVSVGPLSMRVYTGWRSETA